MPLDIGVLKQKEQSIENKYTVSNLWPMAKYQKPFASRQFSPVTRVICSLPSSPLGREEERVEKEREKRKEQQQKNGDKWHPGPGVRCKLS